MDGTTNHSPWKSVKASVVWAAKSVRLGEGVSLRGSFVEDTAKAENNR